MDTRNWKERITDKRTASAEARGETLAKTPEEAKLRLDAVKDRGGIVFVSDEAKEELLGPDL